VETPADAVLPTPSPTAPPPTVLAHIPTLQPSVDSTLGTSPHAQPHLTTAEWSSVIGKAQMGEVPLTTGDLLADPKAAPSNMAVASPHTKVFTADAMTFSLDPELGTLNDCLIQITLNCVFIPLSLNNIEKKNKV